MVLHWIASGMFTSQVFAWLLVGHGLRQGFGILDHVVHHPTRYAEDIPSRDERVSGLFKGRPGHFTLHVQQYCVTLLNPTEWATIEVGRSLLMI